MPANLDVIWSALLNTVSTPVTAGMVLTKAADGQTFVPATTANLVGSSVPAGIARSSGSQNQSVQIQQSGTIEAELTGLGPGARSAVIVDPVTARPVRKASPVGGDVQIGVANERGDVAIAIAGAGLAFTPAGDLGGSSVSQIVQGLQGRPLSATAPGVGNGIVWNGSAWAPGVVSSFTAGGDLTGTVTSQTVAKIQGVSISGTPGAGSVLQASSSTASAWSPNPGIPNNFVTLGGIADGTTDNATALTAAATTIGPKARLYFPPAALAYRVSTSITLDCSIWPAPTAMISVDAGVTLIINGGVFADQFQQIFTGQGTVITRGVDELSPCWFGADPTGILDSSTAAQQSINCAAGVVNTVDVYAGTKTPPAIKWPAGAFRIQVPPCITTAGIQYMGSGVGVTQFWSSSCIQKLIVSIPMGGLSVKPALVGGGPGNAYDLERNLIGATPSYNIEPNNNFILPSYDCFALTGPYIISQRKLSVRFFFKMTTPPAAFSNIFNMSSTLHGDEAGKNVIVLAVDTDSKIYIAFQPINGNGGFLVQKHPTVLANNTVYYIDFEWDGVSGETSLFIGLPGAATTRITTTATGFLNATPLTLTCIGAMQSTFPESGSGQFPGWGQVYDLDVRKVTNYAPGTATFTAPTTVSTVDGNTMYNTKFELAGPGGSLVKGYTESSTKLCYSPVKAGDQNTFVFYNGGVKAHDFSTYMGGIYSVYNVGAAYDNIQGFGGTYGIWLNQNSYGSFIRTVSMGGMYVAGGMSSGAGGDMSWRDCSFTSNGIALALIDGGSSVSNIYAQSSQYINSAFISHGGGVNVHVDGLACTDENATGHHTSCLISGPITVTMNGAVLEAVSSQGSDGTAIPTITYYDNAHAYVVGDWVRLNSRDGNLYKCILNSTGHTPPNATYWAPQTHDLIAIAGTSAKVTMTNTSLNDSSKVPCRVRFLNPNPLPHGVKMNGWVKSYGNPSDFSPLTNNPAGIATEQLGAMAGVTGISSTSVPVKNFRGTITIADAATSATVGFTAWAHNVARIGGGSVSTAGALVLGGIGAASLPAGSVIVFAPGQDSLAGLRAGFAYVATTDGSSTITVSATEGGAVVAVNTLVPTVDPNDFVYVMNSEDDAAYSVRMWPISSTGTPSAGSMLPSFSQTCLRTGFTVNVQAAPGVGNSVTYGWEIVR